jgi:hypothetical protein
MTDATVSSKAATPMFRLKWRSITEFKRGGFTVGQGLLSFKLTGRVVLQQKLENQE